MIIKRSTLFSPVADKEKLLTAVSLLTYIHERIQRSPMYLRIFKKEKITEIEDFLKENK